MTSHVLMSKKYVAIYVLLAAATVIAYITTRSYLISTPLGYIVISNLTLNYVLLAIMVGGFSGWISWTRLFRKWQPVLRLALTLLTTVFTSGLWLIIVSIGGYQLR